jgi:hypothetical protein
MKDLLAEAQARPGIPARLRLSNNLLVSVGIDHGLAELSISRSSTFPSERDWQTIRRHWPTPLPAEPVQVEAGGRYFLVARLSLGEA